MTVAKYIRASMVQAALDAIGRPVATRDLAKIMRTPARAVACSLGKLRKAGTAKLIGDYWSPDDAPASLPIAKAIARCNQTWMAQQPTIRQCDIYKERDA